jgi:hypothetical protein
MKNKLEDIKEFVIFSEYGFFTRLADGGKPQWSLDIKEAKPFDNMSKLAALQRIYGRELLIEYI